MLDINLIPVKNLIHFAGNKLQKNALLQKNSKEIYNKLCRP